MLRECVIIFNLYLPVISPGANTAIFPIIISSWLFEMAVFLEMSVILFSLITVFHNADRQSLSFFRWCPVILGKWTVRKKQVIIYDRHTELRNCRIYWGTIITVPKKFEQAELSVLALLHPECIGLNGVEFSPIEVHEPSLYWTAICHSWIINKNVHDLDHE